jgi:hypothetical protein
VCEAVLTSWCDRKLNVFRLEMSPVQRYVDICTRLKA